MPKYAQVQTALNAIESEMKRIGHWQSDPLPPEKYEFERPFAGDTMAFSQWLQFVFIPRVRQIIAEKGEFPRGSQVGDQAFKEWRMWGNEPDVDTLIDLLKTFDSLF